MSEKFVHLDPSIVTSEKDKQQGVVRGLTKQGTRDIFLKYVKEDGTPRESKVATPPPMRDGGTPSVVVGRKKSEVVRPPSRRTNFRGTHASIVAEAMEKTERASD